MTETSTTNGNSDDLTKKLQNIPIVYVVAQSGVGKTYVGDYLEVVRGWKHIDGDEIFKNPPSPEDKAVKDELDAAYTDSDDIGRMIAAWMAYMKAVANLTLEGVRTANEETCEGIVVTHASYFSVLRNALKEHLLKAGAEDILTVFLRCEQESHMKSIFRRSQRQADQAGCSLETYFKLQHKKHIVDFDSFVEWYQDDYLPPFEPPNRDVDTPFNVIDVTAKDVTVMDEIDDAFGIDPSLSRLGGISYEELVQKIKQRDEERDAAWLADFPVPEYESSAVVKSDEPVKPQTLRARRLSLLEADKMQSMRRLSLVRRSISGGSAPVQSEKRPNASAVNRRRSIADVNSRRRSSFLTTGICEDLLALENLEEILTEED